MVEKTTWNGVFSSPCKAKKKSWFYKIFCPREIILRQNDKVKFIRISPAFQIILSSLVAVAVIWGCFSSLIYFSFDSILENKNDKILSLENNNRQLLAEIQVYHHEIEKIIVKLEEKPSLEQNKQIKQQEKSTINNRIAILAKNINKKEPLNLKNSLPEKENILRQVSILENNMQNALKNLNKVGLIEKDLEVELRKVSLQRDIALSETNDLRLRVHDLENQIANMQDVQYLVFERMSSLASGGVQTIKNNLENIKDALASTGLSVDKLLSRNIKLQTENNFNKEEGKGGPFIPVKNVDLKNESLNLKLNDLVDTLNYWENLLDLQDNIPLGKPLDKIRVTSRYGARIDPFTGETGIHNGLDLGGKKGDSIYATAPGKVLRAGNYGLYGKFVEIEHNLGFRTRYAHMDKVLVKKGDWVDIGDRIGLVGNTGRSTGSHLHYEVRINSRSVNPTAFMRTKRDVFKK